MATKMPRRTHTTRTTPAPKAARSVEEPLIRKNAEIKAKAGEPISPYRRSPSSAYRKSIERNIRNWKPADDSDPRDKEQIAQTKKVIQILGPAHQRTPEMIQKLRSLGGTPDTRGKNRPIPATPIGEGGPISPPESRVNGRNRRKATPKRKR